MSASPQRADWVAVKSAMHQSRQKVRKITCLEQKIVEAVGLQLRCKENLVGQQQRCCCIRVRMLRLIYLHITPSMHHLIGDHPVGRAIYKCSHLHVAQWLNCCLAMHAYSETGPTALHAGAHLQTCGQAQKGQSGQFIVAAADLQHVLQRMQQGSVQ